MGRQEDIFIIARQVIAAKEQCGGVRRVVWIGAGGSNGGNYPAQYFMEHEATRLSSSMFTSKEFVLAPPKYVDETTLAVVVSMRGTPETIEAARVAKKHGAMVVALYVDESELTELADYIIQYESLALDESDMGKTNSAITLALAIELVNQTEGYDAYEDAVKSLEGVDAVYRRAVEFAIPRAREWAVRNAHRPTINVLGAGPTFGASYVFSICNIQEMLQIDSVTTNSCDFFHGPFEVLDKDTSVFLLMGVGRCREADERALAFLEKYGGDLVYVLDARDLGLDIFPSSVAEYFNHLVLSPILNNVYMRTLSKVTGKDYMTRRYMWQIEY